MITNAPTADSERIHSAQKNNLSDCVLSSRHSGDKTAPAAPAERINDMKFYKCGKCGQTVAVIKGSPCSPFCCGQEMIEMIPGTTDAAVEKHVPVYEVKDGVVDVCVGSVAHPMTEEHLIEWIAVETAAGFQLKKLAAAAEPKAAFSLCEGEEVLGVYAYCNLHGLWKA